MPKGREAEAREFYGHLLGLKEIEKPESLKVRGGVWFVIDDGRQLHLGVEEPFRPSRKAHPCFVTDDLEQTAQKLCEAGYEIRRDDLIAPVIRFYTDDAIGNRVEFVDRTNALQITWNARSVQLNSSQMTDGYGWQRRRKQDA
jgi:catechol 2,3-dioxygenase-like lactoylglutathione lyase family enzyme